MRFKKQIFTILILALLVACAASVSAKTGDGAKKDCFKSLVFPSIMKNPHNTMESTPCCA